MKLAGFVAIFVGLALSMRAGGVDAVVSAMIACLGMAWIEGKK